MGKSTLVLQALGAMSAAGARCLLVCAEESAAQVRLRADRLGALAPDLLVVCDTSLPDACAHAEAARPDVVAIDSIQAVQDPDAPGGPGSVSQVRDGAVRAQRLAKELGVATILIGHVTKDGSLAGPRTLEHVVDTVLSFEGDRHHALRMLRALKHRFGPTDELGLMEMTGDGLVSVRRPELDVPRRPSGRGVGLGRRSRARGHAGRCASRCSRWSCRPRRPHRDGSRSRSTAGASRCSSRSCSSAPTSGSRATTCSRALPAASARRSRAPISRSRWRSRARAKTCRCAPTPSPSVSSVSAARCVRSRTSGAGSPRRSGSASLEAIVPASTPDVAGMELVRVADLDTARTRGLTAPGGNRRILRYPSGVIRPGEDLGPYPIGTPLPGPPAGRARDTAAGRDRPHPPGQDGRADRRR